MLLQSKESGQRKQKQDVDQEHSADPEAEARDAGGITERVRENVELQRSLSLAPGREGTKRSSYVGILLSGCYEN